jgi:hypothetical protein
LEITGSSCPFSFDHCIVCPSVWRSLAGQKKKDKRTTSDLQTEGQIIQWSKEKGHFLLTIVLAVLLFGDHWLSSCPFSFDHCIICPSVWRSLVPGQEEPVISKQKDS